MNNTEQRSIFISHRHEDKYIADVFREAFEDWSNGAVRVFQSSHAENAMLIGSELNDAVRSAIANSNLVFLIYTTESADWSWCMYECGLAQDPQTMDTRLVLFHTTAEPPSVFKHLITVPFSHETIKTLADDFHRDTSFFTRQNEAIAPGLDEDQIEDRAIDLYEQLGKAIPNVTSQEVRRYDYLTLGLDIDSVLQLRELENSGKYEEALRQARTLVEEKCLVFHAEGEPQAHFNFEKINEGTLFHRLIDRWKAESSYASVNWQQEVYAEMARALLNHKERTISLPFNSLEPNTDLWVLPIISRFRILPGEKRVEFDLLFCGIESATAKKMIS